MGLDIHVMRPKRFFLRDFTLPVQRLVPEINVQLVGVQPMSAFDADGLEKLLVKAVRTKQLDQESHRYVLPAEDTIVFSERFNYAAFNLLREFAAYQDYPPKQYLPWKTRTFGEGDTLDSLPSITTAWKKQRASYPHLVFHKDNRGFYFPTLLSFPVPTEHGYIGSSTQLRRELTQLATIAHKALRHRGTIRDAITFLLEAIDYAEHSGLPIIFDG